MFIPMQTETEKRTACEVLLRSAACFCFACKAFRITDTKQSSACGTWMAIKPRNPKAMKNTRAGPGHGGGTPPARTGLPVRGKAGNNRSGKARFSPAVFPAFLGALGPSCCRVPHAAAAHKSEAIANPVPQMRVQGDHPPGGVKGQGPFGGPGAPRKPPVEHCRTEPNDSRGKTLIIPNPRAYTGKSGARGDGNPFRF